MKKIVVFVLGPDKPGIIAAVSRTLYEQRCNLEDVSQTILQKEFVAIFIASMADNEREDSVLAALRMQIEPLGLFVYLRRLAIEPAAEKIQVEPHVITTIGPDKPGLMAGITEVLAQFDVNITNLKAVFGGHQEYQAYIMIYEVDIPSSVNQEVFRTALHGRAEVLGLEISLQHRDIFEQLHRV